MKIPRATLAFLLLVTGGEMWAQDAQPEAAAPLASALRTSQELEQLLAPIALYPDALIALILPAATAPADVVLAARSLRESPNDRSQIENRAWEESVKSLTNYPEVLKWMDENLHWTKQVGEAFAQQPADVMQAVQRLRAQARAAGTLVDTPQQQILAEPQAIRIVPAQPNYIYVPHYEPEIVFVDRPLYYPQPFITFGAGVAVGSWLAFDCDWRRNTIWVGNRHRPWRGHDWHRPVVPIATGSGYARNPEVRQWRPPPQIARPSFSVAWRTSNEIARPSSFSASSTRSFAPRGVVSDNRRPEGSGSPVVNPLQHTITPGFRRAPGTRMEPAPTIPAPIATTPTQPPGAPVTTSAPPHSRHWDGNAGSAGERETHTRSYPSQSYPSQVGNPTPRAVPAMRPISPQVSQGIAPSAAPTQYHTYTRSAPAPAVTGTTAISPPSSAGAAPVIAAPQIAPAQSAPASSRGDNGGNRGWNRRNAAEH